MTAIQEYRAWAAVTKLSTAIILMDDVAYLGMGPEIAECKEIRDRMYELKSEMVRRIEEMEKELEGCKE